VLPAADLPFSEGVRHGDTIYLSGQLGVKPGTLELVPGGIEPEARQVMTQHPAAASKRMACRWRA
jgi:enamine deaminase RidA (YjgF/YER057c/UK114 family)